MEPFVVIVKEVKDGKITITESELKSIIQRAYNDGYIEGRKTYWWSGPYYYTTNATNTTNTLTTPPTTNIEPPKYDVTITCDAHNTIGD